MRLDSSIINAESITVPVFFALLRQWQFASHIPRNNVLSEVNWTATHAVYIFHNDCLSKGATSIIAGEFYDRNSLNQVVT